MKRKSLEFQKIRSKLQQRRKKDAALPAAPALSSSSAPASPGSAPTKLQTIGGSRGSSSSNSLHGSSNNSGDELCGEGHDHLRSPVRRLQPPTTPELKMVVAGLEDGAVERKRKQAADALATSKKNESQAGDREPRLQRAVSDGAGSSSGGDGEEDGSLSGGESPTKKRKTAAAGHSDFSQGYAQRLEEAIQACLNAVKEAGTNSIALRSFASLFALPPNTQRVTNVWP
jgi:hypothetical protein